MVGPLGRVVRSFLVTKEAELRRDKFGNTSTDELDSLVSSAQFSGVRLDFLLNCSMSLHTCGRVFSDFRWSSVVRTRESSDLEGRTSEVGPQHVRTQTGLWVRTDEFGSLIYLWANPLFPA